MKRQTRAAIELISLETSVGRRKVVASVESRMVELFEDSANCPRLLVLPLGGARRL